MVNYWVLSQSGKTGLQVFLPHPPPGEDFLAEVPEDLA